MTKLNLKEIEERADRASKERWDTYGRDHQHVSVGASINYEFSVYKIGNRNDANFIAHSRTDIPLLIEAVRDLAKALEAIKDHSFCPVSIDVTKLALQKWNL